MPRWQSHTNNNISEDESVNSSSTPVPDGIFLATTGTANRKAALLIDLHLQRVDDRTFYRML